METAYRKRDQRYGSCDKTSEMFGFIILPTKDQNVVDGELKNLKGSNLFKNSDILKVFIKRHNLFFLPSELCNDDESFVKVNISEKINKTFEEPKENM